MTTSVFQFGEIKPEYSVAVLNERTVRAAAVILFVFALISFMNAQAQLCPGNSCDINTEVDAKEVERCRVPDFAKAMGHEEKWKLHNNCK